MASEKCEVCNKSVETMTFRGTGVCGEICRKTRDGETPEQYAQVDAGITGLLNQPTGEVDIRGIR